MLRLELRLGSGTRLGSRVAFHCALGWVRWYRIVYASDGLDSGRAGWHAIGPGWHVFASPVRRMSLPHSQPPTARRARACAHRAISATVSRNALVLEERQGSEERLAHSQGSVWAHAQNWLARCPERCLEQQLEYWVKYWKER